MKTTKILEQATILLFITGLAAYMINLIFDTPTLSAWLGVSVVALVATVAEYTKHNSPTLLKIENQNLRKKLQKAGFDEEQVVEIYEDKENWKSEFENAKAAFELQQAETKQADDLGFGYKAKWEKAEAEKSELEKEKSELEAKLSESEAAANRWGADHSRIQGELQKTIKTVTTNNADWQIEKQSLEANNAFLEAKQSQYAHATSDLIDKFGHGFFSNDWDTFKPAMNRLCTKYNTNKLNATSSNESRQALMLKAESVETFAEFMPQEAEVLEFKGEE